MTVGKLEIPDHPDQLVPVEPQVLLVSLVNPEIRDLTELKDPQETEEQRVT